MQFPWGSKESAQYRPVSSVIKETSKSRSRVSYQVATQRSDQHTQWYQDLNQLGSWIFVTD